MKINIRLFISNLKHKKKSNFKTKNLNKISKYIT